MIYKGLIFDISKVILECSFNPTFEYWAKITNLNKEYLVKLFMLGDEFKLFEKGKLSPYEYYIAVSRKIESKLSFAEFITGWEKVYFAPYKDIESFFTSLRKEYRIIALTNTNVLHHNIWEKKFHKLFNIFEKVFYSYQIKTRKPESRAFEISIEYLGLETSKIIFLDDNKENVEKAKSLGLHSIQVLSQIQMKEQLINLGIYI